MATRDRLARGVEVGGGVTAGTVGTWLGAAKLRDAYKADHPEKFAARAAQAEHHVAELAPKAGRLARVVRDGKPGGFAPLAALTAAAATATAAKKYRTHRERHFAKSAFGVQHELAKRDSERLVFNAGDSANRTARKLRQKIAPSGLQLVKLVDLKAEQAAARANNR